MWKKKENICRPIIFYNNFVPPVNEKQPWRFCAFGTLDGIDVEENIAKKNEQLLSSVWEHQRSFCKKLSGKFMAQVIYAIKYDLPEMDQSFWSEETDIEYPFAFFVRVQCRGNVELLWEKNAFFQEKLNHIENIVASVYLTYDNSDLIIILKAAKYRSGAAIVNTLRQGRNLIEESDECCVLKNSFTVLAVRQSIIDASDKMDISDRIQQVDIRFIEKQGKGIADIYEKLCGEIVKVDGIKHYRKQVLGTDDEVITFFNIPWKVFLSFYRNPQGILHNANEAYSKNILGTTAVIGEEAEVIHDFLNQSENLERLVKEQQKQENVESERNSKYIDKMVDKLAQIRKSEDQGLCKSLDVVVNALAKFKQPAFSDYLFVTMIRPLDCLLDLIISNAERGRGAIVDNRNAYLDFIKSFNMYTQNSIRSDRHSMQVMDLNAKIYDIPVKLNAFYNAYMFRLCDLLNKPNGEIEYNFFAMPGMGTKVNVSELYKRVNEKRRLVKVEIPEQKYYDLNGTMIVLAHEAAHYVGRRIRKREYRYRNYIQNIAHIYITYVIYVYNQHNREQGNKLRKIDFNMERLEKRMEMMLTGAMERETRDSYTKKHKIDMKYLEQESSHGITKIKEKIETGRIIKDKKEHQFYIPFIKKHVKNALVDVLYYCLEDVFAPVTYDMRKEEADDFLVIVKQITVRFLYEYQEDSTMLSMKTATESLISIYEECFADLMSILILQITPGEYIRSFVDNAQEQGVRKEEIINYDYVFRILFVMVCMADSNGMFSWKEEDILQLEKDEICGEIITELRWICKLYVEGWYPYEHKFYDKNCTHIFKDRKIFDNIEDYLTECKKEYFAIKAESYSEHEKQILDKIRELYTYSKDNAGQGIENQMLMQLSFIREYQQDLFVDWDARETV